MKRQILTPRLLVLFSLATLAFAVVGSRKIFIIYDRNVSNLRLDSDGIVKNLSGFMVITSALPD
ncbi:MAG: hypothetical protein JOZ62_18520 [Acidobacteriaceae bacterium]|nr:hypothetical protein [Acidobacteriaceae bacterium]